MWSSLPTMPMPLVEATPNVSPSSYDTGPAGGGPTLAVVNQEIAKCTAGSGSPASTRAGWVNSKGAVTAGAIGALAVGEDNS